MSPCPNVFTLAASPHNLPLLTTIAAGFAAAWVLGLITQRLGLSPIVGYLLAGVAIGPHTPGFAGDVALAQQLAEIGVILLMFGVGLHFHLEDLWKVRAVAVPGALGQSAVATLAAMGVFWLLGWDLSSGLMLGMAMAVASTVVLLRVLMDRGMLSTSHGHAAVGWLIVEDILTVLLLVMVPILGTAPGTDESSPSAGQSGLITIGLAVLKLGVMVAVVLLIGPRVVPWVLTRVARLRSAELFTLTVLVLSVTIAVGSASLFGASVALGAFLAGIVVAQSPVSHQAAADALPMRDAFAVLFFVSVGMLLDPSFLVQHPEMVLAGLVVVLIFKPLAAIVIVALCGYPVRTALTVAIGLAQIGEFSFILGQVATEHKLLPPEAMNVLVATAMVSITINPLLFRSLDRVERGVERIGWLHRLINARHARKVRATNEAGTAAAAASDERPLAVIVGYGPVGRLVDALLRDAGMRTVVVDTNIDTVQSLARSGRPAIYGDAARREVLEQAGVRFAAHLIVALPHTEGRVAVVLAARELSPTVEITVRARYLAERDALLQAGANAAVFEEGEAGVALARRVLVMRGTPADQIDTLLLAVRRLWGIPKPGGPAVETTAAAKDDRAPA
ncbi:MAG: cation:proton antiporter [Phycisphaerales bacterium]|nr:cation:proton antiporter [Phycisphaerales bacterium]